MKRNWRFHTQKHWKTHSMANRGKNNTKPYNSCFGVQCNKSFEEKNKKIRKNLCIYKTETFVSINIKSIVRYPIYMYTFGSANDKNHNHCKHHFVQCWSLSYIVNVLKFIVKNCTSCKQRRENKNIVSEDKKRSIHFTWCVFIRCTIVHTLYRYL